MKLLKQLLREFSFGGMSQAEQSRARLALAGKIKVSPQELEKLRIALNRELKKQGKPEIKAGQRIVSTTPPNKEHDPRSNAGAKVAVNDWIKTKN